MTPNLVVGIAFILAGLLIGFAGYQIRFKGRLNLIAGYEEEKVKDKEGLVTWVGNGIMGLGIAQASCGIMGLAGFFPFAAIAFGIATVIVPVLLISRISQYTN